MIRIYTHIMIRISYEFILTVKKKKKKNGGKYMHKKYYSAACDMHEFA